ncbi:MAG: hypothetical protein ACAH80_06215 [Alphaproteobacteria bacterium]
MADIKDLEFKDTGLPNDPAVFRAYRLYQKNAESYADESGLPQDFPLKVARAVRAASGDANTTALALLMSIPAPAYSAVEKQFGADTVKQLDTAWSHERTGFAYIEDAPPAIKALAAASAAVAFDNFIEAAATVSEKLLRVPAKADLKKAAPQLVLPEPRVYEMLAGRLEGEAAVAYDQKFAAYQNAYESYRQELDFVGIVVPKKDAAKPENPAFDETGLMEDPTVKAAYELVTRHPGASPRTVNDAVLFGKLLGSFAPEENPSVIAAGIMQAGLQGITRDDIGFLQKRLGGEVGQIMETFNVRDALMRDRSALDKCPDEFRQMALAYGIVMMDNAKQSGERVLKQLKEGADVIPEDAYKEIKLIGFKPLFALAMAMPMIMEPLRGRTGAPALEKAFEEEHSRLQHFVQQNMPEMPDLKALPTQVMAAGPRRRPRIGM